MQVSTLLLIVQRNMVVRSDQCCKVEGKHYFGQPRVPQTRKRSHTQRLYVNTLFQSKAKKIFCLPFQLDHITCSPSYSPMRRGQEALCLIMGGTQCVTMHDM